MTAPQIPMVSRTDSRGDAVTFPRELEYVSNEVYEVLEAPTKARQLMPSGAFGMPAEDRSYIYRMYEGFGVAQWIDAYGQGMRTADVTGTETTVMCKDFGLAYVYNDDELISSAKYGRPLDRERAKVCARSFEQFLDVIGAVGDTSVNMTGLLNMANTTTYTASTKAAGGTAWGTFTAPKATSDEIVGDLAGIVNSILVAVKGHEMLMPDTIVLPDAQFGLIAQKRMGDGSDTTILKHFLTTNPWIKDIQPWHRCTTAGSGSTTRMVAYRKENVKFLIPREFEQVLPPQRKDLAWKVPCRAKTGGVFSAFPLACAKADGI